MVLQEIRELIKSPDREAASRCRVRWNAIAKPLGGLGELEEYIVRIAGIRRTEKVDIRKKALVIFCADNGVVEEGVSQTGQEVTAVVAENFCDGRSCASLMCRRAGADLFPVDVGMAVDTPHVEKRKCRRGTANMTKGPAMTRREAAFAVDAGIETARKLRKEGYGIIAAGEMGIGNTTTSAAVISVLLGRDPAETAGRGAGLSDEGLARKRDAVQRAIELNRPNPEDPLDVLSKIGGFDIAALTGLYLGCAAEGIPVVLDGLITAAAALLAVRLAPLCREYMLASHNSAEPGMEAALTALGLSPVICAGMHLGEGTGAAALFPLLDMACDIYDNMDTFEEISVKAYEDFTGK